MSFVHCPDCQRAYNLVGSPACPHCGVRAGAPADPTEDILQAADQLARAIARATPEQLARADLRLRIRTARLALPSPERVEFTPPTSMLSAVRTALLPAPAPQPKRLRDRITEVAAALIEQLPSRWSTRARALLPSF